MVNAASFSMSKDAGHAVGYRAHDEAVEERDRPPGAGTRRDTTRWQEAEILKRVEKAILPFPGLGLDLRQGAGDAPPGIFDGGVDRCAIGGLEAIFHVPDLLGDGGGKAGHAQILWGC
jgi:hypothetical protein